MPKLRSMFMVPGLPLPSVRMVAAFQSGNDHGGVEVAEKVADDDDGDDFERGHFSSFLPRNVSFTGVPEKPNARRSAFSRYRLYEKCTSVSSLTKITKCGGHTDGCEA